MRCSHCQTELAENNYAVIATKHFCLKCLTTNPSLLQAEEQPPPRPPTPHQTTKQCQVCFEQKPTDQFRKKYSSRCRHVERSICDDCLYQHIREAFGKMCTDDVTCPELNCEIKLTYEKVQNVLSNRNDRVLLDKYERFVLQRQLEKMPEFIWCAHGCGMGQLNDGGDQNNIVTCIKCHRKTCFTHKTEWHSELTCHQYDALQHPEHEATRRWIAQNSKRCPKCSCRIEKADGCDHMRCTQCRYEFCWSCMADYNAIRQDGNHRHHRTCKHYAAYHG